MSNLPNHLGGHENRTHIDESTLNYLIEKFNIHSMYDVGCGPGGMVQLAISKGIISDGIDGDFTIEYPHPLKNHIIIHDFTNGPISLPARDLSWSCEFLEHVDEKYINNYFAVFCMTRVVCCTFCDKEGTGHHHVNIKDQTYWDTQFANFNFTKDIESTKFIRNHSSMSRDFIKKTGTVYINNEYSG